MLRAPLFFSEHSRRGRISLLTDAAVPSPHPPPAFAKPRAYLRGFCFWKDDTPIQGKRSPPPAGNAAGNTALPKRPYLTTSPV
jgi:hypothetical protein